MIPRKFLILAAAAFMLIVLAWSPLLSRNRAEPLIISLVDTVTSSPTPVPVLRTATHTASPSVTLRATGAFFTLTEPSSCYTGPGETFRRVETLLAGETVAVIGRNAENSWWRVSTDTAVTCWIASLSGTLSGEAALIPITSSEDATAAVLALTPARAGQTAQVSEPTTFVAATFTDTLLQPANTVPPVTSTAAPTTHTALPPTGTRQPGTTTARPPTATPRPATSTLRPATSTPRPFTSTLRPRTDTPRPPTSTLAPITNTRQPPASTFRPPTNTPRPPVLTARPPTHTVAPATSTPQPPTDPPPTDPPPTELPPTDLPPTDPPATDPPEEAP